MNNRPPPNEVERVACVGLGLIGSGWAAHFLARGYHVTVWDPDPAARGKLDATLHTAWPHLETLGLADGASRDNVRWATSVEAAVADAQFVQESAPERLDLKRDLHRTLDGAAPAETVIATSTSAFPVVDLLPGKAGGRLVIGHPFNPSYLVPLVEVAGAEHTDPAAIDWACAFYKHTEKAVLRMAKEATGFVANHLQEALFREALHLVSEGIATPEQIDYALVHGLAPRWSTIGPTMVLRLGRPDGNTDSYFNDFHVGSTHLLSHVTPPEFTEALKTAFKTGAEALSAGEDRKSLSAKRDAGLASILTAQHRAGVQK